MRCRSAALPGAGARGSSPGPVSAGDLGAHFLGGERRVPAAAPAQGSLLCAGASAVALSGWSPLLRVCSLPPTSVIRVSCFSENVLALGFKATDMKKKTEVATPPRVRQEVANLSRIALGHQLKWLFPRHL